MQIYIFFIIIVNNLKVYLFSYSKNLSLCISYINKGYMFFANIVFPIV